MTQGDDEKTYTRRDSLRLRGFNYMARQIYFVTIVVLNRQNLFGDKQLAAATLDCLLHLRQQLQFKIYCYCLMPDHFHALIGLGESKKSLSEICGAFKSLSTRAFWQRYEGRLWQRQFFDHIIRNEKDFLETIEYIKMNPVRKQLVERIEQWPYTGCIDELE
jgi:putative transposase